MKRIFLLALIMLSSFALAADKIYVSALEDFSSIIPKETLRVEVVLDSIMNGIYLIKGDILNCTLQKVKDPTRAKRDAKIFFYIESYEDKKGSHEIMPKLIGKYSKTVFNKEEIKKIPPKKVLKKTAGIAGDYFFKGFSYGLSFVDGMVQNTEENRLKSGAKQLYDDSFLSYIEYGEEIEIKKGDNFYLVVKNPKDKDEDEDE